MDAKRKGGQQNRYRWSCFDHLNELSTLVEWQGNSRTSEKIDQQGVDGDDDEGEVKKVRKTDG